MNQEEIKKILPHRDAMLLIDEAEVRDDTAFGKKLIREDEWFLKGHFPGNPVVPGVILCEIMAQSSCVLLDKTLGKKAVPMFTGLDKVRFKEPVRPGDVFETECKIDRSVGSFYFAQAKGRVNGKLCVKAEFSFAIVEQSEG